MAKVSHSCISQFTSVDARPLMKWFLKVWIVFGRVHSVIVGFDELPLALLGFEKRLEGRSCLVVGDVEQGPVPLLDQDVEDTLEGVNDGLVLHIQNWLRKDILIVIIICRQTARHTLH